MTWSWKMANRHTRFEGEKLLRPSGKKYFETLENRTLLSTVFPGVTRSAAPASIDGYVPAQVRQAYDFPQTVGNGSVTADGHGQTIAIVDPYDDPKVVSDLNVFDTQFGLAAPPNITIVNQTGGPRLPRTDAGWAGEIATDVEWAHALAPGARILLVECASDNTSDLMAGVDYARAQSGVSVISLSWGGPEFAGQTAYDPQFKTPTGHTPITVVVAGGDNGGAQWPGTAPDVLSVGGTVLTVQTTNGVNSYGGETSWTDSSGGISHFESEPSFQQGVQRSGMRSMPDVAFDADINTGLALYDSVPYQGITGWQTTNGTSVGTPQWAALIAMADQGRALAGQPALDGPSQVLPTLYGLYGAPGTAAYSNYTTFFHDIVTPQDPTAINSLPTIGYDLTSGLGSPIANNVVGALIAAPTSPMNSSPLASPVTVALLRQPAASVVAGTSGVLLLRLTNASPSAFSGSLTISLVASTSVQPATGDAPIATISLSPITLPAHTKRLVRLKFSYPMQSVAASDFLIAEATPSTANTAPAEAVSLAPVGIAPPFITLTPTFTATTSILVVPGASAIATIRVQNLGNIPADGQLSLTLYDSTDQTLDSSDTILASTPTRNIKILPNHVILLHLRFPVPAAQVPGMYYLIGALTTTVGGPFDNAVIGTRLLPHRVTRG